jgi:uncharacterized membrane protein YeaQ/YmgE (transglycosylase-associated protein family)
MFGLIGGIIVGGFVGWLASKFVGTSRQQGCLMDVIVGVVGAFLGGLGYNLLTGQGFQLTSAFSLDTGFLMSLLVALIGAVVLLFIVRAVRR